MPFCIQCGLRVDPGEQKCAACQAREAGVPVCKRCGMIARSADAQFCIQCGNRFPVAPAPPVYPPQKPPAHETPTPPAPQNAQETLESVRQRREATYHRLGRTLLTLCYQGKLPYEQLPDDLARDVREGIDRIRRGHAELIAAGICPNCQKPALSGMVPKCSECGYVAGGS